jgi:hypothetical protein
VASARAWATSRDPNRLGAAVAALSAAYNDPERARAAVREAGAARLGFSFARDVPKGAAAVRELVATGVLELGEAPLRVLDLGAGLGATTWGVVRALEAAGQRGTVEATWVDADAAALQVGAAVLREREARREAQVKLKARAVVRAATEGLEDLGRFDLVLVGQLLSELDVGLEEESRARRQAGWMRTWLTERTRPTGSLVAIEPALRDRTRRFHRVRDLVTSSPDVTLFSPCLHAAPCPALARETDWCHEDLPVDLPEWLVPVVRAAGLRREGLTFSYLVLRTDGVRLRDRLRLPEGSAPLRAVSTLIASKGKREAFLCGELPGAASGAHRFRGMRLDRDESDANRVWDDLARGEVIGVGDCGPAADGSFLLRIRRDVVLRPISCTPAGEGPHPTSPGPAADVPVAAGLAPKESR